MKTKSNQFFPEEPMVSNTVDEFVDNEMEFEDAEISEEGSIVSGDSEADSEETPAEGSASSHEDNSPASPRRTELENAFELQCQKLNSLLARDDEEMNLYYQRKMVELSILSELYKAQDKMRVNELVKYNLNELNEQLRKEVKEQQENDSSVFRDSEDTAPPSNSHYC